MKQKMKKQAEAGYTLLEILAVLTLMAAMLTLVAPNVIKQLQTGQVKAAKAQISMMRSVLNSYYMDNMCYPSTEQGLKALVEKPSIPPIPDNWNGPYLEDGKLPLDPWGEELKYLAPGNRNPNKYDLFSYGSDKKEGGEGDHADIGNW